VNECYVPTQLATTTTASPCALALHPPQPGTATAQLNIGRIERRDVLGGLIHEYHRAQRELRFETLHEFGETTEKALA
jgi:hypothetical protein